MFYGIDDAFHFHLGHETGSINVPNFYDNGVTWVVIMSVFFIFSFRFMVPRKSRTTIRVMNLPSGNDANSYEGRVEYGSLGAGIVRSISRYN